MKGGGGGGGGGGEGGGDDGRHHYRGSLCLFFLRHESFVTSLCVPRPSVIQLSWDYSWSCHGFVWYIRSSCRNGEGVYNQFIRSFYVTCLAAKIASGGGGNLGQENCRPKKKCCFVPLSLFFCKQGEKSGEKINHIEQQWRKKRYKKGGKGEKEEVVNFMEREESIFFC